MEKGTLSKRALLGFPAFLLVQLILEGILLRSCSALERDLPEELNITKIRKRFCGRCARRSFLCNPQNPQVCRMCREICRTDSKLRCWNDTDYTCGDRALETVCGYLDAVVCKNESANETCVYELCSEKKPVCTTSEQESNPEWAQKKSCNQTATIVIACVLPLVIFLVLLAAGVWYLRRRGKLQASSKKSRNPAGESATVVNTQLPPPAFNSQEYSYAYALQQRGQTGPDTRGAKPIEEDDDEYHFYCPLDKENEGKSNIRYVEGGPEARRLQNTEAPNNPYYFVLEKSNKDVGNDQARLSSLEGSHDYFPLQKSPQHPSDSKVPEHEAKEKAEDKKDASSVGKDLAYFLLKKSAQCPSEKETLGHEATEGCKNMSEFQAGDKYPEYQVAMVSSSPGGDSDSEEASSPYDHLNRLGGKHSAEGDPSDEGFADYQHLKGD